MSRSGSTGTRSGSPAGRSSSTALTARSADRDGARARGRAQRQLDGQDPVLVGRVRGVGVDLRAERDDAPERSALDLELLVDAVVGGRALRLAIAREDQLAAADLQLHGVGVDPGEVGAHDRARRVARVVDVDGGREAAAPARRKAAVEHVAEQLVHLSPHPLEVGEQVPLLRHRIRCYALQG